MVKIKLCNTCKHYRGPYEYALSATCWHPKVVSMRLTDGYGSPRFADSTRYDESACGRDAKWHEPKPPKKSWWRRLFG